MTYKNDQDDQADIFSDKEEGQHFDGLDERRLLDDDESVLGTPLEVERPSTLEDEFSTEFTFDDEIDDVERDEDDPTYQMIGWIAIISSVIAFMFMPLLFGTVGIILGFFARTRHYENLGNTAITLSIIAMVLRLFILPFIQ